MTITYTFTISNFRHYKLPNSNNSNTQVTREDNFGYILHIYSYFSSTEILADATTPVAHNTLTAMLRLTFTQDYVEDVKHEGWLPPTEPCVNGRHGKAWQRAIHRELYTL